MNCAGLRMIGTYLDPDVRNALCACMYLSASRRINFAAEGTETVLGVVRQYMTTSTLGVLHTDRNRKGWLLEVQ